MNGVAVTHLTETGRFMARLEGPVSGNVVVRRTQYRWADDSARSAGLARAFITGKIANARLVLRRGARDAAASEASDVLGRAADRLDHLLRRLPYETDLETLRGIEGGGRAALLGCVPVLAGRRRSANLIRRAQSAPAAGSNERLVVLPLHVARA
jgi:CRISPR-associated protein Cas1